MKHLLFLFLGVWLSLGSLQAQEIVGQWNGVLKVQGINLRIVFHINQTDEGYKSTMDSPDQRATGIPVANITFDGSNVLLELPNLNAKYEGVLQGDSIVGSFVQNGMTMPMILEKAVETIDESVNEPLHSLPESIVTEMKTIQLSDGEETVARLCLPKGKEIKTIVVTVHGTGPCTYIVQRDGFNYYDMLADGFCEKGVGFFTYNRRGVDLGDVAPWYDTVDSAKYAKYLPHIEAEDIETMIAFLKKDPRFANCKIILYGISEGSIIASMVADRKKVQVDALFLHGYAHENLYDIIEWQNSGEGVMISANSKFDVNGDKGIDEEEYKLEDPTVAAYRAYLFQSMPFEVLDVVKDGRIDILDIRKMREPFIEMFRSKVEENDGEWIWNNYFRVTIGWLKEHFELEPNKSRLLRVDVPIYVFHGMEDANVPVETVYELEQSFKDKGKTNLKAFVFDKHNHDLNLNDWFVTKSFSEGLQKIFDSSAEI